MSAPPTAADYSLRLLARTALHRAEASTLLDRLGVTAAAGVLMDARQAPGADDVARMLT